MNASEYVRGQAWSQCKFITNVEQLDFEKPICKSVCRFFKISNYHTAPEGGTLTVKQVAENERVREIRYDFWEGIKDQIPKALNICRNNRVGAMKKCFQGTSQ